MANILGRLTLNELRLFEVDGDPSTAGGTSEGTVGTLAIYQATGQIWRRYATDATAWTPQIYGSHYQYAESLAEDSNTSSTTYNSKLTLTTPSLPSGDYVATVSWKFRHSNAGRNVQVSLLRNSVEYNNYLTWVVDVSARDGRTVRQRFNAISGIQNIELQFRNGGNNTAFVSDVRMEFWRVV